MESVRSIFISDLHLGCRYAQVEPLLEFLKEHQPKHLYLVGDIIDGWRLRRRWHWPRSYNRLVKRIIKLVKRGTRVYYNPGNHDDFLRDFVDNIGGVEIVDEIIHHTADGSKLLVMHGDQFDTAVRHARWLSMLGDVGYDFLLVLNRWFNAATRKFGFRYWSLSAAIKRKVKRATNFISDFENIVTRYAKSKGCVGVVCGHIHTPVILERNGVTYYNTGDWVESCTALVEYDDGRMELLFRACDAFLPDPGTFDSELYEPDHVDPVDANALTCTPSLIQAEAMA